jgi:short-subunit dehydrogenase
VHENDDALAPAPQRDRELAVIVGAAGDIGAAVARHFAPGRHLLLIDVRAETLAARAAALSREVPDTRLTTVVASVTDRDALVHHVREFSGGRRIAFAVNCAGVSFDGTLDLPVEQLEAMTAVNLLGSANVAAAVVPHLLTHGTGTLVTVVSQSGLRARPQLGGYAASKFGFIGFNEALHRELAGTGVRSMTICPGMVNTVMTQDEGLIDSAAMIQPADIAHAAEYLLSLSPSCTTKNLVLHCVAQAAIRQ